MRIQATHGPVLELPDERHMREELDGSVVTVEVHRDMGDHGEYTFAIITFRDKNGKETQMEVDL